LGGRADSSSVGEGVWMNIGRGGKITRSLQGGGEGTLPEKKRLSDASQPL